MKFFKTKINPILYIYWLLLLIVILITFLHINENTGLLFIFVLLIPFFLFSFDRITIKDNTLVLQKLFGFIYTKTYYYNLNEFKCIKIKKMHFSVRAYSFLYYVLTGILFYQPTAVIKIFDKDEKCIKNIKINIGFKDVEKLTNILNKWYEQKSNKIR